ncbi:hypothetical protein [Natronoflexus pectinivorans]|uniref:Uncharacterized protein n=1 Tax=Natronoflexus pectinivorans TaxID=682526 RepID=A0A4R2G9D3_9BACT|nr:hypothetical protein [Natronoflexus pectinivorans]TCO04416.1 hypothetical protein EV194_1185 [Natronoflexus pectinivorans]
MRINSFNKIVININSLLVAVILLNGCNNHNHLNKLDFNADGVVILNNWYMVGPFNYDTTQQSAYPR